ncbi:MAG: hypothetical protein H3C54_02850 [Taibaiella sp.]|nr:hypothetical protein [Taibaiella sp.]
MDVKKEKTILKKTKNHVFNPTSTAYVTSTNFETSDYVLSEIVEGQDQTDTYIRKIKLFLSVGLTEVCKDDEIAEWIYTTAMNSPDKSVKFIDLFTEYPSTKSIIENAVDPLGEFTDVDFDELEADLDYMGFQYWASIFLTNDGNADVEYKPIITPGLDAEDRDDPEIEDVTPAWFLDAQNNVTAIKIWEELAYTTEAPVYAVSLITKNSIPTQTTADDIDDQAISDVINSRMNISKYQVGYKYDKTRDCEYTMTGYATTTGWGVHKYMRHSCYMSLISGNINDDNHYNQISKLRQNNMWQIINSNKYMLRVHHQFEMMNNKGIFFNTYERDWYAGRKFLGSASWGSPGYMYGRMEYAHE